VVYYLLAFLATFFFAFLAGFFAAFFFAILVFSFPRLDENKA